MRILELQADNFKRLKAVSIIPSGNIVEVTGENGAGKSSTLDAIWAALGGKDACPAKPIRSDAEDAIRAGDAKSEVRVVLGEGGVPKFRVTRRFKLKEGQHYTTDLIVESEEGGRFDKPQNLLDAMLGEYCFDPLEFVTRLKDAEQVTALRKFVPDVDFAKIEGLNKRDYDERTEINRRARDLQGQIASLPTFAGETPEPVDIAALEALLGDAAQHNTSIERRKDARSAATDRILNLESAILRLQGEIAECMRERDALQEKLEDAEELPEPINTDKVRQQMAEGRQTNERILLATQRRDLEQRLKGAQEGEAALTQAIDARKAEAAKAVRAAKMPVDGLGFGDGFVTLNGEPLAQASMAQKIRTSVAIAAAMNPRLRVVRVTDGSLLDKMSWAILTDYAAENDLQVWIESVTPHLQTAVMIEDGGIVERAAPEDVGDVV